MRIDAHQHFWKYDPVRDSWITDEMKIIRNNFLPKDLQPHLELNGMDGSIAVQSDQSEEETNFLISLAEKEPKIKGVVGWVDLKSDNLEERLDHFSKAKSLKGFRHIVQGEPSGFLKNETFIEGVSMLGHFDFRYDLLVYHHQLKEAVSFVREVPETSIILDHLAKPAIKAKDISEWSKNIQQLAECEHVTCKISGMVTEADWVGWEEKDFYPYLDVLLKTFGTKRLLYGSDWPVCLIAATYDQQLSIVTNYISKLTESEQADIMGNNAVRIYQL